ncbi:Superfamily I DNA and RNA helicase [Paraburkholderia piptadeniae]|uniref:Superfamily I DNA and RNA helicase n=1 Tax=Paraburkholderia piptadeniae TaxID=1701573 RepID=A0A1N7RP77_9BURK|nr:Superfamily I DNA and RNA helicase [Paraburkholderia piptadeniae]
MHQPMFVNKRSRWTRLRAAHLVCALMVGMAGAAFAQTEAAALAPNTPQIANDAAAQVAKLPLERQVKWLRRAAQSGALEQMDDAQLVALFESIDPLTVPRYIEEGPNGYPSYEFTMLRQERIRGVWPRKPDHMLVRLTRDPLRIYSKWLPGGPHSGQEIIYDESRRSDEMYGHLGGLFNIMPLWTSIDGSLARAQSNHRVRDLGTEFIAQQFLDEGRKFAEAGITHPAQIEVKTLDGVRVVAFTYETPTGQPEFYAKKEVLGLDLRHPYFRMVESYGNDGQIFERIVFVTITPKTFDDMAFDPKNPEYKF